MRIRLLSVALVLLLFPTGVAAGPAKASCPPPFTVAKAEALGWNKVRLKSVGRTAHAFGSAALLVVTDGKIVLSQGRVAHNYQAHSIRKSMIGALFGIAEARGDIDLTRPVGSFGPLDATPLSATESSARVIDLLAARSGIFLEAAATTPAAVAKRPLRGSAKPGSVWYYNNWDFNALGEVYRRATGRDVFSAFAEDIARPLCMRDYDAATGRYEFALNRSILPSYNFRISARDLAAFGQLYMDRGRAGARQVVPAQWVDQSVARVSPTGDDGLRSFYGLLWWRGPDQSDLPGDAFVASGWGGHRLIVIPSIRTVMVNRMDTDNPQAPRIGEGAVFDNLVRQLLAARQSASGR